MRHGPQPRFEKLCSECDKPFMVKPSAIRKGNGFCCSNACGAKRRAKSMDVSGDKNPHWKGGIIKKGGGKPLLCIPKVCKICGVHFKCTKQNHNNGWAECCSRSCRGKLRFKRNPWTGKNGLNYKGPEHVAASRKTYAEWYRKTYPQRMRAGRMLRKAVKEGRVIPTPCIKCGAIKVQGHHPDYSPGKELDVEWLCPTHHKRHHVAEKKQYEQYKHSGSSAS